MSNGSEGGRDGTFRLPRPTFGLFFPFFFGPISIGGGRRSPPGTGRGLSALPVAVPQPPPFSPPPIFQGPAANDPIFKRALARRIPIGSLGRLLGLGGLVITAAEILVKGLEKLQVDRLGDILAEQDQVIARINIDAILTREALEKALRVEKQVRALESAPETLEQPIGDPLPALSPQRLPAVIPDIFPQVPAPFPVTVPSPLGVPGPVAPTLPSTPPQPLPTPLPLPTQRPFPIGSPLQLPVFDPLFSPVGDPDLLTGIDPTPLTFAGPGTSPQFSFTPDPRLQPQLDPQTNPDRCKRRCDDRENRTQCFKGLFRESTSSIDFTDWQEVDCISGRDIESTGVAGRIASNVVELF